MTEPRGRQLLPGQTSRVHVYDVGARTSRLVFESSTLLVEAPNVLDDDTLVLNGGGDLWLLPLPAPGDDRVLDETALVPVPMPGVEEINNDHVLDRSDGSVVVSARNGELYRVPLPAVVTVLEGGVEPRYPTITGRMKAKKTKVEVLAPQRAPDGTGRVRLLLPPAQPSTVEVLGTGPDAAPAVVDLLHSLGVAR